MCIPSYFNFILKNHPNIIIQKKYISCDYLFIDANSLIYDSINELNFQFSTNDIVAKIANNKVAESSIDMINVVPNPYYGYSEYETNQLDTSTFIKYIKSNNGKPEFKGENAKYKYLHDSNDSTIELIDTIEWTHNTTPISNKDILAEQQRLQDIEDAKS